MDKNNKCSQCKYPDQKGVCTCEKDKEEMNETNLKCEKCDIPMSLIGGLRGLWGDPAYLYQCLECKMTIMSEQKPVSKTC